MPQPPASGSISRHALRAFAAGTALVAGTGLALAADLKAPVPAAAPYDWSGAYLGGHVGQAWAASPFRGPDYAGSVNLQQTLNTFNEAGSFFTGFQGGYNLMLKNRAVVGVEVDTSFPAFPNLAGYGIGGGRSFNSPAFGSQSYSDNLLTFGTIRGRIGYAPGDALFYATGGLSFTRDQLSLIGNDSGNVDYPYQWRLGYAVGAGVEVPIAPHWTGKLEYLFTDFGSTGTTFDANGQRIASSMTKSEVRAGLNYRFGESGASAGSNPLWNALSERTAFHVQATEVLQGYPAFKSPYQGVYSLPGDTSAAQTTDVTLYGGVRLWQNAEFWINPEVDQGFGLGNTHGAAGFPSGESYKIGKSYPYSRVQRYFVRDTVNLGGATQEVEADLNQFAQTQTANRLVLTIGKFSVADVFDTNKYANNPKLDFLNWSLINAGTLDYAGDAWGFSYGATAELYTERFAFRAGLFDLSQTPAGSSDNIFAYGLDPTFRQVQAMAEVEERHEIRGQPGKLKLTGFVSLGRAGTFGDAVTLSNATGADVSDALAAVRHYQARPGISLNLEQGLTDDVGLFARAGYTDGSVEPWDFTDIDRTVSGGLSIAGKRWGRPDDTVGIAGVLNGLAPSHASYFANGGIGILIGDGQLPVTRLEQIFETYYNVSLSPAVKLSVDYQNITHPAYNPQRGPVNLGAIRLHGQF